MPETELATHVKLTSECVFTSCVFTIAGAGGAAEPGTLERRLRRALRLGLDPVEARMLAAVALVRLLIMPLASIFIVKGAGR